MFQYEAWFLESDVTVDAMTKEQYNEIAKH